MVSENKNPHKGVNFNEYEFECLMEDAKKLAEALEFYSNAVFYQSGGHAAGPNPEENYAILKDAGFIANQALEEFKANWEIE